MAASSTSRSASSSRRASSALERAGRPQRVDARAEQRLVGVDVAHAGEERLLEEQRLDGPPVPGEALAQLFRRKLGRERLRAEACLELLALSGPEKPDAPEAADIPVAEFPTPARARS
jgi:hypothetical protein